MRAFGLSLASLALSGCLAGGQPVAKGGQKPIRKVSLASSDLVVQAPEGYCVDTTSVQETASGEGSFVMLADCGVLMGQRAHQKDPVVMTVAIAAPRPGMDTPTAQEVSRSFASSSVVAMRDTPNLALVGLATGGNTAVRGADARYWRGAMRLRDRLVSIALYAPKGSAYTEAPGASLLGDVARLLVASNSGSGGAVREVASSGGLRPRARP